MIMTHTASLHETTVQNAAALTGAFKSKRARKARTPKGMTHIIVDPRVMAEAKRLARGDLSRLEIVDAETVIVHNARKRGPR